MIAQYIPLTPEQVFIAKPPVNDPAAEIIPESLIHVINEALINFKPAHYLVDGIPKNAIIIDNGDFMNLSGGGWEKMKYFTTENLQRVYGKYGWAVEEWNEYTKGPLFDCVHSMEIYYIFYTK